MFSLWILSLTPFILISEIKKKKPIVLIVWWQIRNQDFLRIHKIIKKMSSFCKRKLLNIEKWKSINLLYVNTKMNLFYLSWKRCFMEGNNSFSNGNLILCEK